MAFIGVELPAELKVGQFAAARIKEIVQLRDEIAIPRQGQLPSQQVPRHMRRRAVSHNPNRLPRKLRKSHVAIRAKSVGAAAPAAKKPKRPSRKYRRRPKNLLEEYNRRQRKHAWLETHIWHAKRFHMADRWGYRVPDYPNDKCFRACYRAAAQKCLMQDVSYYSCIQIEGPSSQDVISKLSAMGQDGFGGAEDVLSGKVEGRAFVYRAGKCSMGAIGQVAFLWNPSGERKTLWIFCHPAFYEEFQDEVIALFGGARREQTTEAPISPPRAKRLKMDIVEKDVNGAKLATRNVPFDKTPKYDCNDDVTITLLKDTLNRFRIVGPQSGAVLGLALAKTEVGSDSAGEKWWRTEYMSEEAKARFAAQCEALAAVAGLKPSEMPVGSVVAATVRDPRMMLPQLRGAVQKRDAKESESGMLDFDAQVCNGHLWNPLVRDEVSLTKRPDAEINKMRSVNLVPGSPLALADDEARVPVLLVRQPGDGDQEFGAGWDLILPAGWGTSFWINLVYQGARVGGAREARHLALEKAELSRVAEAPESLAGQKEAAEEAALLRKVHFSHPPDKRANFVKLGSPSPFSTPWRILIEDYLKEDVAFNKKSSEDIKKLAASFFVLRDRQKLKLWKQALADAEATTPTLGLDEKCALVPVRIEMVGKGNLSRNTMICVARTGDEEAAPEEPIHEDSRDEERRKLKDSHKTLKAKMRSSWKEKKQELEEKVAEARMQSDMLDGKVKAELEAEVKRLKKEREEANEAFVRKTELLWVPEECLTGKDSSSRTLIGWVTEGGYSYRAGKAVGLGFVTALALDEHLSSGSGATVMTREADSVQYRLARMDIVI